MISNKFAGFFYVNKKAQKQTGTAKIWLHWSCFCARISFLLFLAKNFITVL